MSDKGANWYQFTKEMEKTLDNMTEPERSLPEDQVKIENEDKYEETELQTMERAMDLSKQFEQVKQRTVENGMVLGKLVDIQTSANNDRISVEIDLPAEGDTEKTRFRKPKRWSEEYKFVRWIKHYGYDADSFPNMIQDECKVKVSKPSDNSEYELFVPEKDESYREKISMSWDNSIWKGYKVGPPILQVASFIGVFLYRWISRIGYYPLWNKTRGSFLCHCYDIDCIRDHDGGRRYTK